MRSATATQGGLGMKEHPLVFVAVVFSIIALLFFSRGCDDCAPGQRGEIHFSRLRDNRMEQCNGSKWVPYTAKEVGQ